MAKKLTEDAVRDKARDILGFKDKDGVRSGVGQITTFNQLGLSMAGKGGMTDYDRKHKQWLFAKR